MDKFIPIKISDVGSKFKWGGGGHIGILTSKKNNKKKKEKIMVMSNFAQKVGGLSIH